MKVAIILAHLRPGGAERQAFETALQLQEVGVSVQVYGLSSRLAEKDSELLSIEYPSVRSTLLRQQLPHRVTALFIKIFVADAWSFVSAPFRLVLRKRFGYGPQSARRHLSSWYRLIVALLGQKNFGTLEPDQLLEAFRQKPRLIFHAALLKKHLVSDPPDLMLSFLAAPNVVATITGELLGIPVIVSERNDILLKSKSKTIDPLALLVYPAARLVTANTEVATSDLAKELTTSEVRWLPNYMSQRGVEKTPSATIGNDICVIARLVPQKRISEVIESLALSPIDEEGVELHIFGLGREQRRLRSLASKLALSSRVHFLGYRPRFEIQRLVTSVRFVVINSAFEGSSNSLHEAVSWGLVPIVADSVREIHDIVSPELATRIITDGSAVSISMVLGKLLGNNQHYFETLELLKSDFGKYWERAAVQREAFFRGILDGSLWSNEL